jgi:hypothetical protein
MNKQKWRTCIPYFFKPESHLIIMTDYGKTLGDALRFSVHPRRWMYFFILDLVFFTALFVYLFSNLPAVAAMFPSASTAGPMALVLLIQFAGVSIFLFIVWFLIRIYIVGALIHQSVNPDFKKIGESWTTAKQRYFSLLVVIILVSVASSIVGAVPYVGWLLSIIVGLIFFFAIPPTIIDKKSFDDSIRISIDLFREKTADVFLTWILLIIMSAIIIIIFSIPALAVLLASLLPVFMGMQGAAAGTGILNKLVQSGWYLYPAALIFLVGFAITSVFSVFFQANMYQQIKKKKLV